MARAAALALAALAAAAAGAILWLPQAPRWLALAAVACVAAAFACAAAGRRLHELGRHRFRVLGERYTLTIRPDEEAKGAARARGHVRVETVYESLRDAQSSLRLQKFVAEPTRMDPVALLKDWNYACRVVGPEAREAPDKGGPGGKEEREAAAQATLSESRSLQVEVTLPQPVARGETFTFVEDLDFASELRDGGASLTFQVSYPTRSHDVEILFEGLRPETAEYRINRGQGVAETGPLAVGDLGGARTRIVHQWRRPEVGEELALRWRWDPRSLPAQPSASETLIAEARARQAAIQERLAAQIEGADGTAPALAPKEAGEGGSAEDHPVIKAARAREQALSGRSPTPAPPSQARAAPEGGKPRADDPMAEAMARQTTIRDLLAAQVRTEEDAARAAPADPTGEGGSAEDHPIIKAARAREQALSGGKSGKGSASGKPRRGKPAKPGPPGEPAAKPPRDSED
jgi:hypothetical protein